MYTAQDVAFHLLASTGGGAQDGEHHAIRLAVIRGYEEVVQCRQWKWHERVGDFVTQAAPQPYEAQAFPSSAGAVLDFGLSISRLQQEYPDLWPSSAPPGQQVSIFSGALARDKRWPFQVLTDVAITARDNPGSPYLLSEEITDGTPRISNTHNALMGVFLYVLDRPLSEDATSTVSRIGGIQSNGSISPIATPSLVPRQVLVSPVGNYNRYDLPANVKDIDSLINVRTGYPLVYVAPQDWLTLKVNNVDNGEPHYYTVMRSGDRANGNTWQIRFVGTPTAGVSLRYTYRYIPKPLKYIGYEFIARDGRVTVAAPLATVTKVSGDYKIGGALSFPSDIEGSVIRFGTEDTPPEPEGSNNPYLRERRIEGRNDPTSITVDEQLAPRTAVQYCITDPIDVSPTMFRAVLSAAEMWYARIAGKPADGAMAVFNRDLRIAMENDSISPLSGRPPLPFYRTPRAQGWHSPLLPDLE